MHSSDFPGGLRIVGCAFAYWIVFLLALEPGNVLHARSMGHAVDFDDEALRIAGAALLGCSTAPLILALSRRFPVSGPRDWRSIAIHAAAAAAISGALIVVSCFLAAWVLMGETVPSVAEVGNQLAGNWVLLTFALGAFVAIGHAMKLFPPARQSTRVAIKTRGRLGYLDLASIEWIESQGNYLALHVGGRSHLIRETLQSFAARLDADRYIRVHRRTIVAVDRIREIQPLANGDSTLILQDGRTIRASRSYREAVRKRWAELSAGRRACP
jgi:two-component system, LytTR family, response regulator